MTRFILTQTPIGTIAILALTGLAACSSNDGDKTASRMSAVAQKVLQCRQEYEAGKADMDALTCRVEFGQEERLATACQPATDKAGNVLYESAEVAPSPAEWQACLRQIDQTIVVKDIPRPTMPCDRYRAKILTAKTAGEAKQRAEAISVGAPECTSVASKAQWDFISNSVDTTARTNGAAIESETRAREAVDDAERAARRERALKEFEKIK